MSFVACLRVLRADRAAFHQNASALRPSRILLSGVNAPTRGPCSCSSLFFDGEDMGTEHQRSSHACLSNHHPLQNKSSLGHPHAVHSSPLSLTSSPRYRSSGSPDSYLGSLTLALFSTSSSIALTHAFHNMDLAQPGLAEMPMLLPLQVNAPLTFSLSWAVFTALAAWEALTHILSAVNRRIDGVALSRRPLIFARAFGFIAFLGLVPGIWLPYLRLSEQLCHSAPILIYTAQAGIEAALALTLALVLESRLPGTRPSTKLRSAGMFAGAAIVGCWIAVAVNVKKASGASFDACTVVPLPVWHVVPWGCQVLAHLGFLCISAKSMLSVEIAHQPRLKKLRRNCTFFIFVLVVADIGCLLRDQLQGEDGRKTIHDMGVSTAASFILALRISRCAEVRQPLRHTADFGNLALVRQDDGGYTYDSREEAGEKSNANLSAAPQRRSMWRQISAISMASIPGLWDRDRPSEPLTPATARSGVPPSADTTLSKSVPQQGYFGRKPSVTFAASTYPSRRAPSVASTRNSAGQGFAFTLDPAPSDDKHSLDYGDNYFAGEDHIVFAPVTSSDYARPARVASSAPSEYTRVSLDGQLNGDVGNSLMEGGYDQSRPDTALSWSAISATSRLSSLMPETLRHQVVHTEDPYAAPASRAQQSPYPPRAGVAALQHANNSSTSLLQQQAKSTDSHSSRIGAPPPRPPRRASTFDLTLDNNSADALAPAGMPADARYAVAAHSRSEGGHGTPSLRSYRSRVV